MACGLTVDQVRAAIAYLEGPDPESRTTDHGGARIIRMDPHRDWGWVVVNLSKYQYMRDIDEKRRQDAERARKYRENKKTRHAESRSVTRNHTASRHTDTNTDTDKDKDFRATVSKPRHDPASFERFWSKYPKKRCRAEACAEWDRLRPDKALLLEMSLSLERYVKGTEPKYLLDPNRWLKRRRWEDEAVEQAPNDIERAAVRRQIEARREQYDQWAKEAKGG